jgi:signal peptidase I
VERDDIVLLVPPGRTQTVVTRVVAVGGDVIEGANGRVTLNGTELTEGFLESGMRTPDFENTKVPDGAVFVLGDNRLNSVGSPMYGPVPLADLREHVVRTDTPAPTDLLLLAALALVPLLFTLFGPWLFGRARRDMVDARDALAG